MIDATVFDEIAKTLGKVLPPGVSDLKQDFERNAKSTLQQALGNLDVVTREEFDVQTEVLLRTRERLQALEERIAVLEGSAGESGASS